MHAAQYYSNNFLQLFALFLLDFFLAEYAGRVRIAATYQILVLLRETIDLDNIINKSIYLKKGKQTGGGIIKRGKLILYYCLGLNTNVPKFHLF